MAVNVKRRQSFAVIATRMACKLLPPFRTFELPSLKDRLGSKARHALATGRSPACVVVRGVRISNFVIQARRGCASPARAGTTRPLPKRALQASIAFMSRLARSRSSRPIRARGEAARGPNSSRRGSSRRIRTGRDRRRGADERLAEAREHPWSLQPKSSRSSCWELPVGCMPCRSPIGA